MKYKILVVDDNYAEFTKDLLKNKIDADFDLAYNGLEAFNKFRQNFDDNSYYSLIVMDINMPVMNGIDAIENIRQIDKKTPIIVHSSMTSAQIIQKSLDYGANAFVSKGGDLVNQVELHLNELEY